MSEHLKGLSIGSDVDFKHIAPNVKIQYPFGKKTITMLVGGTGITPMIQALHAILGTASDTTQVTMIYGNKTQKDILCKELLDAWAANSGGRLKIVHVLSRAKDDASWKGETGHITKEILTTHAAPASDDTLVVVCGPPPMYNAFCGPRDEKELTVVVVVVVVFVVVIVAVVVIVVIGVIDVIAVAVIVAVVVIVVIGVAVIVVLIEKELTGILADMGYTAEQVFKF
ncbi:unnamed protein product [Polarella glacialis]|uniref:Oxidoreductase FAD/NAD(P)-binding domain-containing protein n=1 Tax=Polarella glacialis TaxID=89957 RepID=A0A813HAM7_POLGL|nr:unnamed protein product [Polarella glacialis]